MDKSRTIPSMGRPRSFDIDKALDRAMEVFWRQGYEGSSLSDLTKAMGINRPSMYAAFGDKEALFQKAVERYVQGSASFVAESLSKPRARDAIESLLRGSAAAMTDRGHPKGCLLIQGALVCGRESESIRQELNARRVAADDLVRQRLKRAKKEGDLPADVDENGLAQFYVTVIRGMGVQAAGGASRPALERVVAAAMHAWPGKKRTPK